MKNCIGILVLFQVLAIIDNSDSCGPKHIHCHNGKWFQFCFSLNNKTMFTGEKLRCGCNLICDEYIGSFACISKKTYDAERTTSTSSISTTFTTTSMAAESNSTGMLNTQFPADPTNHETFNITTKEPFFSTVTVSATNSNTSPVITTELTSTIITNSFSANTKTTETNFFQSTRVTEISTDGTTIQPTTASVNNSSFDQNDALLSTELTSLTFPTTKTITESTNSAIISTVPTLFTEYLTNINSVGDETVNEEMDTIETDVSPPTKQLTNSIDPNTTTVERDTAEFSTVNVVTADVTISTIKSAAPAADTSNAVTTNSLTTTTPTTCNTSTSSTTTTTITTKVSELDCKSLGKGYYPASKCYQYYECYQILFFWFSSLKTCSSGYAFNSTSKTCIVNSLCIQ